MMVGVVAKQLGVKPQGWETIAPEHPTLADVHTVAEREEYQAKKRAHKAALRAAAGTKPSAPASGPKATTRPGTNNAKPSAKSASNGAQPAAKRAARATQPKPRARAQR